uniref:hypothetical protein, Heak293 Cp026_ORF504_seminavis n=1 Tax=Fibrocapsa japonica TaxID=94617 RepID=UPI002115C9E6|nr:hypothetical protein, Heak293 Cp026_ORF504_seminavis [Fibrocapsa japonica]UTE95096.1 hypothetical protein, Heak293 Cp026_ORF504_seminavis [Fibrocapsa japonica]
MNQNKLSFESENLVVDYISFKFQDLGNLHQTIIAKYLFQLGFNSYKESNKLAKPIKESILVSSKNKFEVCFVGDNPYWNGTLLHFSGRNATRFYFFSKEQRIDWTIFSSAIFSRFDLYFERNYKTADKISGREFLQNCQKNLEQTNKNISLEKNRKGWILKIGNRKSNHYFRIYETKNSLKFEHEMKGKVLQQYHLLLVENRLEEFEQKLSSQFLIFFGKLLPLQFSYLDWLVLKLRHIRKQTFLQSALDSDYIKSQILMDTRSFIMLLQFLTYAQHLDFEIESLGGIPYRQVTFKVRDFLEFQNPMVKSTNHYQLEKIKKFLQQLQTEVFLTSFDDTHFESLVAIPQVKLEKSSKQKYWIGKVWLVDELFYYSYPFSLPNIFQTKLTKDQLEVRFKFIQVFTSASIQKVFFIQELLSSYSSVISNQRKNNIKKYFIQLVHLI